VYTQPGPCIRATRYRYTRSLRTTPMQACSTTLLKMFRAQVLSTRQSRRTSGILSACDLPGR